MKRFAFLVSIAQNCKTDSSYTGGSWFTFQYAYTKCLRESDTGFLHYCWQGALCVNSEQCMEFVIGYLHGVTQAISSLLVC